jgi:hypothetical protein
MNAKDVVNALLEEEIALPEGYVWVIRVDGSATNRPNYYGPFPSFDAADKAVEGVGAFQKSGPHSYDLDTGSETVDIVTGYAPAKKRLMPAAKFATDWAWAKTEL